MPAKDFKQFKNGGRWDQNSILKAFEFVHGQKYDYSKFVFSGILTKSTVICLTHGAWEISPDNHVRGKGCRGCAVSQQTRVQRLTQKQALKMAVEKHGDKYDLSKFKYVDAKTPAIVICPEHGEWQAIPVNFLWHGKGCRHCGVDYDHKGYTLRELIRKAKRIHGNAYDYSKAENFGVKEKTKIVCPKHGIFLQRWEKHLAGNGCRKCSLQESDLELKVKTWLRGLNIDFVENCREQLNDRLEIDIYIPAAKLGIELHGEYWHSGLKAKRKHKLKADLAVNKDIRLLQFWGGEILQRRKAVQSLILAKLNLNQTVYARKCEVAKVDRDKAQAFLDDFHLQGPDAGTSRYYGLFLEKRLMALMSFSKRFSIEWELTRFVSRKGFTIVGGASRLLKTFIREFEPQKIITYADRRYTFGSLYKTLGFLQTAKSKPTYFWYKAKRPSVSKYKARHSNLVKWLDSYDENLSESENMTSAGYVKVYDAGHIKFELDLGDKRGKRKAARLHREGHTTS